MEKLSIRIADILLKKNHIEEAMYSIYQYGMQMALEVSCSFVVSIVICCICGKVSEGIIFFATFIPLRSYLGGVHMKNYWSCFICSCMTLIGILLLIEFCEPGPIVSWIILITSTAIIILEAQKARILDEDGKHYYPKICIIVASILIAGIAFSIVEKFSILLLLACTNALVVMSKILEKTKKLQTKN